MKTFTVTAKRWDHGWELYIDDGDDGVTQSRSLATAERQARDYIYLMHGLEDSEYDVTVIPELGADVSAEVIEARALVSDLEHRQTETAAKSRAVARRLVKDGLTGDDTARVLGVSPQRISQLLKA